MSTQLSLAPATTRIGDTICFLRGYVHPVVVRNNAPVSEDIEHKVQKQRGGGLRGLLHEVEMETC
jgi:hypothetical protein